MAEKINITSIASVKLITIKADYYIIDAYTVPFQCLGLQEI